MSEWREICSECDGRGERDWLSGAKCYECGGTGLEPLECPDCGGSGIEDVYGGNGTVLELSCTRCKGSGREAEAA